MNGAEARVVARQDMSDAVCDAAGMCLVELSEWKAANKKVACVSGADVIWVEAFCDVEIFFFKQKTAYEIVK